jgi:general secretion pathway protein H
MRGFTLIEMLVVLVVMGILIGLVTVNALPDDRGLLRVEAERLAQLLTLAAEESRLTGKSIRWAATRPADRTETGAGYQFWRLRPDGVWSEIRDNDLLRARTLPQGMLISGLRVDNMNSQGVMQLEFVPYGSSAAFTVDMTLGAYRSMIASSPVGDVRVMSGSEEKNASMAQ